MIPTYHKELTMFDFINFVIFFVNVNILALTASTLAVVSLGAYLVMFNKTYHMEGDKSYSLDSWTEVLNEVEVKDDIVIEKLIPNNFNNYVAVYKVNNKRVSRIYGGNVLSVLEQVGKLGTIDNFDEVSYIVSNYWKVTGSWGGLLEPLYFMETYRMDNLRVSTESIATVAA